MFKEFEVHMLNEKGKERATEIRDAFDRLLSTLVAISPDPSREMSICRTKLEEACFFAKKAMATNTSNVQ